MPSYRVDIAMSIEQVAPDEWNALFAEDYPFIRYEFLHALEKGGSIGGRSGWLPKYLLLYAGTQLVAAMPWYLKLHSYGEYLFDWSFAEAYQRHGLQYYPKLLNAIPFTPCEGPRLGRVGSVPLDLVIEQFEEALQTITDTYAVSNWQSLYVAGDEAKALDKRGWWQRFDVQFQWFNRDYRSFEQFLMQLKSRKRKQIRKERALVSKQGIRMQVLEGSDITSEQWQLVVDFYRRTYTRRSGHSGYVSAETFAQWRQEMPEHIVVFAAFSEQIMIAASLCFRSENRLYGRYWGCVQEHPCLHFEACYYAGMEYCIEHNLRTFDAGAQGEHKLLRGFEPVLRQGYYHFSPSPLQEAVYEYCLHEQTALQQYVRLARTHLPFAKTDD